MKGAGRMGEESGRVEGRGRKSGRKRQEEVGRGRKAARSHNTLAGPQFPPVNSTCGHEPTWEPAAERAQGGVGDSRAAAECQHCPARGPTGCSSTDLPGPGDRGDLGREQAPGSSTPTP